MMTDQHSVAVFASIAAASSLLSFAAAAYLVPLWQTRNIERDRSFNGRQQSATKTPEPYSSSAQQPGTLFSPVNRQKRPDPYDPEPRKT